MKVLNIFWVLFLLVVQVIAMYLGYQMLVPTLEMMATSGLHKLASLFTLAPLLFVCLCTSASMTITLFIRSVFNIKRYWWLFVLELASIVAHIYIVFNFFNALKGV